MKRRIFIASLGSAAAWPVVAWAQRPSIPVIGFLNAGSADYYKSFTVPYLQGLKETGFVEGQNLAVEYRYAENQLDRLRAPAADHIDFPPTGIQSQHSGPRQSRFPSGPGEMER